VLRGRLEFAHRRVVLLQARDVGGQLVLLLAQILLERLPARQRSS
jgi:hypothetical protein